MSQLSSSITPPATYPEYWAAAVDHNFRAPAAGTLTQAFFSTVGGNYPVTASDLLFVFSLGRLAMVGRATGKVLPDALSPTIVVSDDPRRFRGYISVAEVEVVAVDRDLPYQSTEDSFVDKLTMYLQDSVEGPIEMTRGDARPLPRSLGLWLSYVLSLD